MNRLEILRWYEQVEFDFDSNVDTLDMPEGDFKVLETEYEMLRAVLGINK